MATMTDAIRIGSLELRNRFFRSATNEYLADEETGEPGAAIRDMYRSLAEGGTGLIVTGQAFVERVGRSGLYNSGIDTDDQIEPWRRTIGPAQKAGARVIVQLNHCGAVGSVNANPHPISPSGVEISKAFSPSTAMTHREIERVIAAFGAAAARAAKAGLDGVQIHGCHGFLVTQFLTPRLNLRTDEWGGDPSRRMEFLRRVIRAIREAVGPEYPVWIKLGVGGAAANGPSVEEGLATALMCKNEGIDCIEVAHGWGVPEGYDGKTHLWFLPILQQVREALGPDCALAAIDGFSDLQSMNRVLQDDLAQLVGFCRPLIAEPDLPIKLMEGRTAEAACVRCGQCRPKEPGEGVACHNAKVQEKLAS